MSESRESVRSEAIQECARQASLKRISHACECHTAILALDKIKAATQDGLPTRPESGAPSSDGNNPPAVAAPDVRELVKDIRWLLDNAVAAWSVDPTEWRIRRDAALLAKPAAAGVSEKQKCTWPACDCIQILDGQNSGRKCAARDEGGEGK